MKKFPTGCPGAECFKPKKAMKICDCLPECVLMSCKKKKVKPEIRMGEDDDSFADEFVSVEEAMHMKGPKGPKGPKRIKCVDSMREIPSPDWF